MKAVIFVLLVSLAVWTLPALAAEHGGKEHGGMEHGTKEHAGAKISEPSKDEIRAAMSDYVTEESKKTGTLDVFDKETGKARKLSLIKVHERVGKTGDYYYSCADFKDAESGETLDLDVDVEDKNGKLSVADVRIHKVNGKERYTYDEHDNRIPVSAHTEAEHAKEHGGKEHGGK